MSMHIGVVNIEYIDQPDKAVCSFLQEAAYFLSGDRRTWSGAWESNAFLETDRPRLLAAARYYARDKACPPMTAKPSMTGSIPPCPGAMMWLCCTWIGKLALEQSSQGGASWDGAPIRICRPLQSI